MQAALIVAPAPFCGQLLRAGAALFHAAARLFAAKETSKATAQDDVSARAAQILDAHGNAILRYAYSYLHNMADAEEVLQDTLVQFLKTAPRFESEAHEKAWLLRVAGNLSKNRLSYNAVRAAAAPESAGKGVLIVFNDRIYSARFAAKRHPTNPDAFGGGDFGALGLIAGSHVEYLQTPVKKHTVRSDFTVPAGPLPRVDILTSHADDDGVLIRAAVEAGARGIIYAGTGNGSVHEASEPWLFDAAEKGVLIVRASRTGDGMTTEGLAKWQKAGFIPAGTLSAQKARILLQLILLESRDAKVAAELFSEY